MEAWIIGTINDFGYIGIALLIAIENIFPPIPSEVILTFAGFMTSYTETSILFMILFSTLGSVVGALILYFVGRFLSRDKLERLVEGKVGRTLRFKSKDVSRAYGWFEHKSISTVFFCRFIPIIRSLISIPAGMAKMKFVPFVLLTTLGSGIWNTLLIFLGKFAGSSWNKVSENFSLFSSITAIFFVCIIGISTFVFYKRRFSKVIQKNEI